VIHPTPSRSVNSTETRGLPLVDALATRGAGQTSGRRGPSALPLGRQAFTLIEVLVATTIFIIIVALVAGIFGNVTAVFNRSASQARAFEGARLTFDLVGRTLAQATLNTYTDYVDAAGKFSGESGFDNSRLDRYARNSSLHFYCDSAGTGDVPGEANTGSALFFQAPLGFTGAAAGYTGLDQLMSVCGYYIEFGDDVTRPAHVENEPMYRYRLKQVQVPSQDISIYQDAPGSLDWFTGPKAQSFPIADNIIALIFRPEYPDANPSGSPHIVYKYDSKEGERENPQETTANQLPPVVHVTMVAIDENSAKRLAGTGSAPPAEISAALSGKFKTANAYETDLRTLEEALATANINYHVYTSTVPIRESRWSK
jgi:uncharacterized protein (TIGR02599 family)